MGKLKDKYLMLDTPDDLHESTIDLFGLPNGSIIQVTKFGSIPFHYFKEDGAWLMPGRISIFETKEVNEHNEPVEVLYVPREG